jgi:hypothetical protein
MRRWVLALAFLSGSPHAEIQESIDGLSGRLTIAAKCKICDSVS